jgi:ribonucleoside-diphosphate reductase beta chain
VGGAGPRLQPGPRYGAAIQRTLVEVGPVAEGVLRPKWIPEDVGDDEAIFGASVDETRAFALQALERRLKVIGLAAAA